MANTNTPIVPDQPITGRLEVPQPNPFNLQAVKRYIFNETGNIMLASTELEGSAVPQSVRDVFAEVSVFFAAMTKAISTSVDPVTKTHYSLYNYNAIQNVVDGSGLFVHVTEEDIIHDTTSYGATFSRELIEGLLGLAAGAESLSFAQAMIASIGQAGLTIGGNSDTTDQSVANIVFVCEYLLGMPIVSAIVVSCNASQNRTAFQVGPCAKGGITTTHLTMHKDTYLFVTPTFIRNYSGDLDSVSTDVEFLEFVDYLQALVQGNPIITAVETLTGAAAPPTLALNATYVLTGAFLDNQGQGKVTVAWVPAKKGETPTDVTVGEVQPNLVSFAVTKPEAEARAIGVYFNGTLAVSAPMLFTAAKAD